MNTSSSVMFFSHQNGHCKLIQALILGICILGLESCHVPSYAKGIHQKADELALVGYQFSLGVQSKRAFFVRNISMRSHVMAELERDIFICAGNLVNLSTNPFQLCHPHLVVIGKASINSLGVH